VRLPRVKVIQYRVDTFLKGVKLDRLSFAFLFHFFSSHPFFFCFKKFGIYRKYSL